MDLIGLMGGELFGFQGLLASIRTFNFPPWVKRKVLDRRSVVPRSLLCSSFAVHTDRPTPALLVTGWTC